jgi:hypothetical protein
MEALNNIAAELIEKEVLNAAELDAIIGIRSDDGQKEQTPSDAVAAPAQGS